MQQLAKSMGSFTWAMSLFGIQQMTGVLTRPQSLGDDHNPIVDAFDAVTRASIEQSSSAVQRTFEAGDRIQRDLIDSVFRLVPLGGRSDVGGTQTSMFSNPMDMVRRATGMARDTVSGKQPAQSSEEELGWGPVPPVA